MSTAHYTLAGSELHYPMGHSQAGISLILEANTSASYAITDPEDKYGWLQMSTTDGRVVWGDLTNTASPSHWWIVPKNASSAFRVKDTDGTLYFDIVTTTGGQYIQLGNATTNPIVEILGAGGIQSGGSVGTSGQVLTSGGTGAAASWATLAGTAGATFTVNSGATGGASSDGTLTIESGDGLGTLYTSRLVVHGSNLYVRSVGGSTEIDPAFTVGYPNNAAAGTSTLRLAAASGGSQNSVNALKWTASSSTLEIGGYAVKHIGTQLGFFSATPVAQQTVGAVTNSVTSGGTTGTIANYTDLTVYATDAAAIRNNIYQLARSVAEIATALRNLGLGA